MENRFPLQGEARQALLDVVSNREKWIKRRGESMRCGDLDAADVAYWEIFLTEKEIGRMFGIPTFDEQIKIMLGEEYNVPTQEKNTERI